jgi:hypothetical protein
MVVYKLIGLKSDNLRVEKNESSVDRCCPVGTLVSLGTSFMAC